jgi:hypothetical protein
MSSAACLRSTAGHGRSAATHSEHRPPVEDLGAVSFGDYTRRGFVEGIRIRLPTSPGSSGPRRLGVGDGIAGFSLSSMSGSGRPRGSPDWLRQPSKSLELIGARRFPELEKVERALAELCLRINGVRDVRFRLRPRGHLGAPRRSSGDLRTRGSEMSATVATGNSPVLSPPCSTGTPHPAQPQG